MGVPSESLHYVGTVRPDEHQRNDDGQGDEQLFGESNRYVNDIDCPHGRQFCATTKVTPEGLSEARKMR